MEYTLFDDYITLQALLKELGIIQSGGAAKVFLSDNKVFFNGQLESRRGKKIRIADTVAIPDQGIEIAVVAPNQTERLEHEKELAEKKRVAELVKSMNKEVKKTKTAAANQSRKNKRADKKSPVRFPGT
ncbi:S4 domain-containing protein YaaA [Streptococcus panodentis]|uniref:S4 domain-containing protein YaaA n=1 Tax=Streptococcus panodentis TaxID=1581472 RepID=A0ABS5AUJ7_9STRE|nr:S4 domain-containing protein YaaA [Streptococcus panodentis]MBP2620243.1 S4 domain-containing protein YaaA [Streptococcus panodentis]